MGLFLHIFWTSVVPILALVAVGFILDKKFNLDLRSLSKLNFFILLPAYVFRSLYTAHLTLESVGISVCAFIILFSNSYMALGVSKFMGYDRKKAQIVRNATMFNNGGLFQRTVYRKRANTVFRCGHRRRNRHIYYSNNLL